ALVTANEVHAAREFTPQHRLAAEIVGVSVGMTTGKVVASVVSGRIEPPCSGAAEATCGALEDVAAIDAEPKPVTGGVAAGRAGQRGRCGRGERQLLPLRYAHWVTGLLEPARLRCGAEAAPTGRVENAKANPRFRAICRRFAAPGRGLQLGSDADGIVVRALRTVVQGLVPDDDVL